MYIKSSTSICASIQNNENFNKNDINFKKSLGQNFLIDSEVVCGIVDNAEVSKEDLVIEIGPGLGTLTSILLERAGKVVCIELDSRMVNIITDRFSLYENFEVINEDVLKVDLKHLIEENIAKYNLKRAKVVANLPYYITTPIIMKLLEDRLNLESITVMVQKEVAERLAEVPGGKESGAITYSINYFALFFKIFIHISYNTNTYSHFLQHKLCLFYIMILSQNKVYFIPNQT